MVVDLKARARIREEANHKALMEAVRQPKDQKDPEIEALMGAPFQEVVRLAARKNTDRQHMDLLQKIGTAIAMVYKQIPKQMVLPKIFPVRIDHEVKARITSIPSVKVSNNDEIVRYLQAVEARLSQMVQAISMIAVQKPAKMPEIKIPTMDMQPLIDAVNNIPGGADNTDVISAIQGVQNAISVLANRPQMTAQPVTNISINALAGSFHATTLNVGTTATALPTTAIANRRSIIVYNNSANTIYLGDSNVSTTGTGQGLPIPTNSYSPSFQAGSNMTLYGIAGSTSSVTILEISDNNIGR